MKKTLLSLILTLTLFSAKTQNANFEWAKSFYGLGQAFPFAITTDKLGNVYSIGKFFNTIDIDFGIGVNNLTSYGYSDIYITKIDSTGNLMWINRFGGILSDDGTYLTIDISGNLVITGIFAGSVDFDPGVGTFVLTAPANVYPLFYAKFTSNGDFIWAKKIEDVNTAISSRSLVTDKLGNILVTGQYQGTSSPDFDPGVGVYNLPQSAGNFDVFITKLDSMGNFNWAKKVGGTSTDIGMSILVDSLNNVYTSGLFSNTVDFDPGPSSYTQTALGASNKDIFVLKLNALGEFVWVKNFGSTGDENCNSTKMDGLGNIYIAGSFNGNTDFDPSSGVYNINLVGYKDGFVSKMDTAGNFIWAKSISGSGYEEVMSIDVDDVGNSYITGYYVSPTDFDPGSGTYTLSALYSDTYIEKLNSSGDFVWVKAIGSSVGVRGLAICVDDFNNVYTSGWFGGTVDFDTDPTTTHTMTSGSSYNIFIHKLSQNIATTENELSIIDNSNYFYPNPNNGFFTIDAKSKSQVIITNMLGQEVYRENINSGKQSLQMPEIKNGVYTLTVISGSKKQTFKIIKQ
jgi:hypothetical protein